MDGHTGFHRRWRKWIPSEAQRRVLELLLDGQTNAAIAARLKLSFETVKWHISELLAETGLESRQELAEWWRYERDKQRHSVFVGLLPFRMLVGLGVIAALTPILLGFVLLFDGSTDSDDSTAEMDTRLNDGVFVDGEISPAQPLFNDFYIEVTTLIPGNPDGRSQVTLRDLNGNLITVLDAGYAPMVTVRHTSSELLVSSLVNVEQVNRREEIANMRLEFYSLDTFALTRSIELPNREVCKTFCQPLVLSADERYLYYDSRTTAPECGAGGDAAVCDVHAVVAVDLSGDRGYASTELPRGCGIPAMGTAGASGAIVSCRGPYPAAAGYGAIVRPEGSQTMVDFGGTTQFLAATDKGDIVAIYRDGTVSRQLANGSSRETNLLPSGMRGFQVSHMGAAYLDSERLFVTLSSQDTLAFVIFNLESMTIVASGAFPGAVSYLPQGERLLMLRDGRVDSLDLQTGTLTTLTTGLSDGVEVLLPGQ